MLMSPRNTLISCGNSSSFQRRSHGPTDVNLWLIDVVTDGRLAVARRTGIVRNFKIVNNWPSMPARCCRKSASPGDVSRTASAMIRKIGTVNGREHRTQAISNSRFQLEADHWLSGFALRSRRSSFSTAPCRSENNRIDIRCTNAITTSWSTSQSHYGCLRPVQKIQIN